MTVNIKDNIEYAAAMVWFVEHPVFKEMEDKSAYIKTLMEYFRVSVVQLLTEVMTLKTQEDAKNNFARSIGIEDFDYFILCALGYFIVNDDYNYYEKIEAIYKTPALRMNRPNVKNCIPEFTRLYAHWLDWFIHRNPPEASEKYEIIAPYKMTTDEKANFC